MSFRDYLGAKSVLLCMAGIGGLYLALVFYFCGLSASLVGILMGSGLLLAMLCIVVGWRRADRRLRMLRSRLDALPEKYLIGETMDLPQRIRRGMRHEPEPDTEMKMASVQKAAEPV